MNWTRALPTLLFLLVVAPFPALGQVPGGSVDPDRPGSRAAPTADAQPYAEWFPQGTPFPRPRADPQEPGFRAALYLSNLLAPGTGTPERPGTDVTLIRAGERDPMGLVALGETFPVFRFTRDARSMAQVGLQAGVTARFRLGVASNDMVAHDWTVGLPVDFRSGTFSGRLRLFHRSAHLGDEIIGRLRIWRIGFSHEAVGLQLGWNPISPFRLYGGANWLARSETSGTLDRLGFEQDDRFEVQMGSEFHGAARGDFGFGFVAALDLQVAERTGWDPQWSALAGTTFQVRSRNARIAARVLSGPSIHGEFFLTPETAWGLEFAIER